MNHFFAAQDLLYQAIVELVSEQYNNFDKNTWESYSSGKAASWACCNKAIEEVNKNSHGGFARAKIGGIRVYSTYVTPN